MTTPAPSPEPAAVDAAAVLVQRAVDGLDGLAAIISGEISRDWADFYGPDYAAYQAAREALTTLRALAALSQDQGRWEGIGTAPKDGRRIVAGKWHGASWAVDITYWERDGWWQMRDIPPTHWTPATCIPVAPVSP